MAITIDAIHNMMAMVRAHQALERQDAQNQEHARLVNRLSDNSYGAPAMKLPEDDTGRPIKY